MKQLLAVTLLVLSTGSIASADPRMGILEFQRQDDRLLIAVDGRQIAAYIFYDARIPRPYFAHVRTLNDIQVSRNHPPIQGTDRDDHATMHPGIWLAFGDLNGSDFWRNQATVKHVRFTSQPTVEGNVGRFAELKRYETQDGVVICDEHFQCEIELDESGWLLKWDSVFSSQSDFFFGDQEEMGLGFRVATPLAEQNGGRITDAKGRLGAKNIWSHSARWCDYSGTVSDRNAGMTILCHPDNPHESWMHARDYGFVAANAFGRHAMHKGPVSKLWVRKGDSLRMRYAVWVHSEPADQPRRLDEVWNRYAASAND